MASNSTESTSARTGWRSRLEAPLVLGVIVALPLLLIEGGSRLYLRMAAPSQRVSEWIHLKERPPAYEHADYFSEKLVFESMRCLRRAPGGGFAFLDFEGEYVRVKDGMRQTTDQPQQYSSRIRVFGASSVFSRRVPDRETIPSHLQRLLNARRDGGWLVTNHGLPGLSLRHVVGLMSRFSIQPGDIFIFYGGVGEVFSPVFGSRFKMLRRPEEARDEAPAMVQKMNFVQGALRELRFMTGDRIAALRILDELQRTEPAPPEGESGEKLMAILDAAQTSYAKLLVKGGDLVSAGGGRFYNFLQPNLLVTEDRSAYEQWLVEKGLMFVPGLELEHAMQLGYPMLVEAMTSIESDGVRSVDVSDAFLKRAPGTEVYFDYAHVNHVANELIAQRMFEAIFGEEAGLQIPRANSN